jgi:two-component system, NarL family, invasion response regulator UvrY
MDLLIVDDHEVVRTGVRSVLQDIFSQATIYEAYDEKSALVLVKERNYHLIIMDVQMPNTDSFGFLEYIKLKDAQARVLVFSMSNETIYAKRFLKSGAMGFVSKSTGLAELTKAVELVMNGRKYISENLSELLAQEFDADAKPNQFDLLSKREFEVAALLMKNKTINEIASILSINSSTVASHKARVLEKMNAKNITELIEIDNINKHEKG